MSYKQLIPISGFILSLTQSHEPVQLPAMDLEQLWRLTLSEIETQLSRANFATWLKNSRPVDRRDGALFVALPNNFATEWVENKYNKALLGIVRNFDSSTKKLEFMVDGQGQPAALIRKSPPIVPTKIENRMDFEVKIDPETNLNPRYSLRSFVVGPSNELAYNAAIAVIQDVGTKYNPFFVYGGVGLGKTHLIQMIGNEVRSLYGGKLRPRYVSSEKF